MRRTLTEIKQRGGARTGAGRPPKLVEDRALFNGKLRIHVSPESGLLAQRLMLHFPDVPTVEALYELAMRRLAEHTDD